MHTKEPWESTGRFVRKSRVVDALDGKADICDCYPDSEITRSESDANSDRIVSCVNALAGRDPAALAELEEYSRILLRSVKDARARGFISVVGLLDIQISKLESALAKFRKEKA